MNLEHKFKCDCGNLLAVESVHLNIRDEVVVELERCKDCKKESYDEGFEDGKFEPKGN